jgi:uncharacterized protein YaaN involved in tellurite resistance
MEQETITLTAPATAEFQLNPPEPVAPVPAEKADKMIKLPDNVVDKLDVMVNQFVDDVINLDSKNPEFTKKVDAIHSMGSAEIKSSASVSNRMLDRPVKAMKSGLFDEGSQISQGLVKLRNKVEELDPAKQGNLFEPRKIFGIIPFGNKIREYFDQYQSAQGHINAIIESLYNGQEELKKDNIAIEQEKANLWDIMQKLEQYVYLGKKIDEAVTARIVQIESSDMEKARVVKEELLFYMRQKVQDLLTQMTVSIQGYLALDMVRKNNLELIKGVDRATTTTISALRTAVIVAQALANQKLVLDQISALNATTGNMIESTSELLKMQGTQIHEQAASSTIKIEQLQRAFNNIYEAMDTMSNYKVKALDSMGKTIDALTSEIEKSKTYLDKVRQEEVKEASKDISISKDGVVSL